MSPAQRYIATIVSESNVLSPSVDKPMEGKMTTTTRNWNFFTERLTLDEILDMPLRELPSMLRLALYGGEEMDGYVQLIVGPFRLGIESDDEWVRWSTPVRWAAARIKDRVRDLA